MISLCLGFLLLFVLSLQWSMVLSPLQLVVFGRDGEQLPGSQESRVKSQESRVKSQKSRGS
jgi:hypothetical protein